MRIYQMKVNLLEKVTGLFVALSITAVIFVTPVMSQDEDEDAAELGKIQVTGSRLNQTDMETAQPVTVISREQIELSGFATVAEVLQTTPYNSFGSFKETSGYANGQASVNEVSLRGLGSARTLVLVDGRRIASTGGSGGAAQNLNQIPASIVERIEILRDGASAIYGSDAIAGVVNIITRKDFDGLNFSVTSGTPQDGADYTQANITGGVSNSKGNIFFTLQHYDRRPQYYRDIDYASHAYDYDYFSSFGYPSTAYMLGNNLGIGGYVVDPRCPEVPVGSGADTGSNSSDTFPNSYRWAGASGGSAYGRCGYDFAQDIISIPRAKRNAFLMKSSLDLSPDVTMNTVLMISQNDSDQRFAGTPITSPYPTIYSDNPNHPLYAYGIDCAAATVDCGTAIMLMRSVPNGTRDNNVVTNIQDLRIGFEGIFDILGGANWELNLQVVNNDTDNTTQNLVNKSLLQAGLDNFEVDPWGINSTLDEVAAQMLAFNHTSIYQADLKSQTMDFIMDFDIGELAGGAIGMVVGAEYNQLYFKQLNDPESNAFIIAGSAGGDNIQAQRSRKSMFFEMGLPWTEKLNTSIAGRYDSYSSDGIGSNFSPQINMSYRPNDWILVRATYGEGFRAAGMDELYGNRSESFPSGIDIVGCASGASVCTSTQYRALYGGNPELKPELSDSWTYGVVLAPLPELTVQLGFWHTEYENLITTSSLNREFSAEAAGLTNYVVRYGAGDIGPQGGVNYVSLQYNNFAGVEAEGLDIDITYIIDTDNMGRFDVGLSGAKYLKYIVQTYPESPRNEYQGEMGLPDLRINPHLYWGKGDLSMALTGYYLSGQSEDHGSDTFSVGSHMEWNLQAKYQLPWNAALTVGATNLTNEEPEQNSDWYGWEPFSFSLYDTRGRTVYFRYDQSL
jgi:iron complex outermembrane receptor protein